ncbi:MAG: FKBP-type peptidyl-prolyl cis-trans isomerase [Paludibacteraceae bacterium]|nr:FKBP-type peptidyl-prolyl cis-trans isomerase [Paludibacteraceae bacterium]
MKKLSIFALAALAMVSCGNTYKVQQVELNSMNDSVNFALGLVNGAQIRDYYLANDSSDKTIGEFIDALSRGYDGKAEQLDENMSMARNLGFTIKSFETKGLVEQPTWRMNEKIFFQALVNGMLGDTVMMQADEARQYFQSYIQAASAVPVDSAAKTPKAVKAKCGKKMATVDLSSVNDSLNYAFGVLNGSQMRMYVLLNDTTGEIFNDFVDALNGGLKCKYRNPQLASMGEQIGQTIREQEAEGLIGVPQLSTDFDLIKQGFINGLYRDETIFDMHSAGDYIQTTIDDLKYGENKVANEKFLIENALKDGIIVTPSGLQYEVIKMGKGAKPAATDKVRVHYHGTLIDGTVFDSSVERGEPISFGLDQVIAGWTEGLQLMPVGSKFRFYIPQELGYGSRATGAIPPFSTLIFDVELLDIEK